MAEGTNTETDRANARDDDQTRTISVALRPVAQLEPYDRNARQHSEASIERLVAIIREMGWTAPILVDGDGIVAGHKRRLAALSIYEAGERIRTPGGVELPDGMVPVIDVTGWSEAQRRAYILADNQTTLESEWDEEVLRLELSWLEGTGIDMGLTGFDGDALAKALDASGNEGEDSDAPVVIPELPRNPISRQGDLWILGAHRLLCGDATCRDDVRRLMDGERAVLFATDPPYLVDYDGSNHPTRNKDWSASYGTTWDDSSQGAELYDGFIAAAVAEAITEDAAWYCWHASRRQAMLEACWERAGAFVHQQLIWVKDRGVLTRSHYLWKHEPCFMGWRRPNRPPKVAGDTPPSTWEMPSFASDERPDHPTPKPLDAFGIPMRQHVARGGLCYEPFSGSGSQIMAGEANGRRVFAMEISPAYVDVAVQRWQAETGHKAVLGGDGRGFDEIRAGREAA